MSESEFIERIVSVIVEYDLFCFASLPDKVIEEIALTREIDYIEQQVNQKLEDIRQD